MKTRSLQLLAVLGPFSIAAFTPSRPRAQLAPTDSSFGHSCRRPNSRSVVCRVFSDDARDAASHSLNSLFPFLKQDTQTTNERQQQQLQQQRASVRSVSDLLLRRDKQDDALATPADDGNDTNVFLNPQTLLFGGGALLIATALAIMSSLGLTTPAAAATGLEQLVAHPQDTLQSVIDHVQSMGPAGVFYFGLIYFLAEILCIPATPLTLSAGYLFGLTTGAAVVLMTATLAASVSFVIGKTVLRTWVEEELLPDKPVFAKLDRAVGREGGFQLLLLVRLSPIFPFALANYLYGASSIDFASYFWGTLLGFAPGTLAYVYTGMVGQALTVGGGDGQPWYVYGAGLAGLVVFLKLVTDVASGIVNAIDEEDE